MRIAIVTTLVLASSLAYAKPKIAILGLEPVDAKDTSAVAAAKNLTENLRARARAGTGPYVFAPGSDLDLAKVKQDKKCASEAPSCMAAIGAELGADELMYGKLENAKDGYKVTVKLMAIAKKKIERAATEAVGPNEVDGVGAATRAKAIYAKLTGQ